MKILLIQPPIEDFYITPQRLQPTGLLYIASSLKKAGHEVKILDLLAFPQTADVRLDKEIAYLSQYYENDLSPFKIFSQYRCFGASLEKAKELIQQETFDVCGISSNFTCYWKMTLEIAQLTKQIFPNKMIIVGGNSVPITYEAFLNSGFVDFIVFGEGERTVVKLLQNLDSPQQIGNIAFKKNDKTIRTASLPDFDVNETKMDISFLNTSLYKIGKHKALSLVTSRGCPMTCSYCTATINCLAGYQRKDINFVITEIEEAINTHQISALNIEDENFTLDRDYAIQFLQKKIELFPDVRLYFMNGLHYPSLDDELLTLLRKADCFNLGLALVDNQNTELISRSVDMEKISSVIGKAKELGFLVTVYIIAGLPGQTKESIIKMMEFIHEQKAVVGLSIYYPMPRTNLFDEICQKDHRASQITWTQMRSSALSYQQEILTRKELVFLLRYSRMINLMEEAISLPDFSEERKGDRLIIRLERQFSSQEMKTFIVQHFKKRKEFLLLKENRNGHYGADHEFKILPQTTLCVGLKEHPPTKNHRKTSD